MRKKRRTEPSGARYGVRSMRPGALGYGGMGGYLGTTYSTIPSTGTGEEILGEQFEGASDGDVGSDGGGE